MKTLIIVVVLLLLVAAVVAVLNHPAFGRRMGKERKARIEASPNWRDGQFQNQIPTLQLTGNTNWFSAVRNMLKGENRVPKEPIFAVFPGGKIFFRIFLQCDSIVIIDVL